MLLRKGFLVLKNSNDDDEFAREKHRWSKYVRNEKYAIVRPRG